MDKKIIYAVVVGIILFALGIALRIFANAEGPSLILFYATFFIVGFVATGVKRGFILSFALAIIFASVTIAVFMPETFTSAQDINVMFAVIVFILIAAVIGGILGAVGGFLGKRIFK